MVFPYQREMVAYSIFLRLAMSIDMATGDVNRRDVAV
jgi:hypothetical protein